MNLLRAIAFIIAVITVILTSDDILSERLVKDYSQRLDNADTIDRSIAYSYAPVYHNLAELRLDYPDFTPAFRHWSPAGSGWLYKLGMGAGPGSFAITLPDRVVLIGASGEPDNWQPCGTSAGDCEVVAKAAPRTRELGVTGYFYYADKAGKTSPAIDIAAYWETQGQVETRGHCIWAHSDDISGQNLTVESVNDRSKPWDTEGMGGFYKVVVHLADHTGVANDDGDTATNNNRYVKYERLSKEQFLAHKDCLPEHPE